MFIFNPYFLVVYVIFNLAFSLKVYKKIKPFFEENKIHDEYPEFRRYDSQKFSFWRLFLGGMIFAWIKLITGLILFFLFYLVSKITLYNKRPNEPLSQGQRKFINFIGKILVGSFVLFSMGVIVKVNKPKNVEKIYKSILGDDYNMEEKDYSLIISNHLSFLEIIYYLFKVQGSFVARSQTQHVPLLAEALKAYEALYVDRSSKQSREEAANLIKQRQLKFMNDPENNRPLMIYPEGTVSNGTHLISFKRGPFNSLLPVKPYIVKCNKGDPLPTGSLDVGVHFYYAYCFLYHTFTFYDLPVIKPTEFMFEKYRSAADKVDAYVSAVKDIMSYVGELGKSDKSLNESNEYVKKIIEQQTS